MANKLVIPSQYPQKRYLFSQSFQRMFQSCCTNQYEDIAVVCIGSDRSTGDSLGPLVGSKLKFLRKNGIHIFGDLEQPVHANNLITTYDMVQQLHRPFIIAIDASLGAYNTIGNIYLRQGSLKPGQGVGKDLFAIGDMSITAVVNMSGIMNQAILQCTSLYHVMQLADVIASGLQYHLGYGRQKKLL